MYQSCRASPLTLGVRSHENHRETRSRGEVFCVSCAPCLMGCCVNPLSAAAKQHERLVAKAHSGSRLLAIPGVLGGSKLSSQTMREHAAGPGGQKSASAFAYGPGTRTPHRCDMSAKLRGRRASMKRQNVRVAADMLDWRVNSSSYTRHLRSLRGSVLRGCYWTRRKSTVFVESSNHGHAQVSRT